MSATHYKLLPPVDPSNPEELIRFRCSDCKESVFPSNFDSHARMHRSTSITVDTTLPKEVKDLRDRSKALGSYIQK